MKKFESTMTGEIAVIFKYHHTSWARGYVSRKSDGYAEPYKGRLGIGFIHHAPAWSSTVYHYVFYYLIPGITKKDLKVFESDYGMNDVVEFMSKCGLHSVSNYENWFMFCELAKFLGIKIIPEVKGS